MCEKNLNKRMEKNAVCGRQKSANTKKKLR